MNENQPVPSGPPGSSTVNERILRTVTTQQRISRLLTGLALLFGFISIAASIALVIAYFFLYLPKQKQLLLDYQKAAQHTLHNYAPNPGDLKNSVQMAEAHIFMTHVTSFGTMLVAISVAVLASGTLVMLMVVILNRRLALSQINANLAQISAQIKELRTNQTG